MFALDNWSEISVSDKKVMSYHANLSIKHFSTLEVGICYCYVI